MNREPIEFIFGVGIGAFFVWMIAAFLMQGKQYNCQDVVAKNDFLIHKLNSCENDRYKVEIKK